MVGSKDYCGMCKREFVASVQTRVDTVPHKMVQSIRYLEDQYLAHRVVYSDEAETYDWVNTQPKQADPKIERKDILNGVATGFVATGKAFTSKDGVAAAAAVRHFFAGPTICECEGATTLVAFRAMLDALGDAAFNLVFNKIEMKLFSPKPISTYFKSRSCTVENQVNAGDWVYIYNDQKGAFGDLAQFVKKGGAASGWNLVCTEVVNGGRRYLGFGLSTGQVIPKTLDEVKAAMVAPVKDALKAKNREKNWENTPGLRTQDISLKLKFAFEPDALRDVVVNCATAGTSLVYV